jgi:CubicO group peptidase (beta-lactamase class C family)
MLRPATTIFAASLAFSSVTFAQHPAADPARQLDAYTTQAVKDWGAVGLAVAVVKDGRVVFE